MRYPFEISILRIDSNGVILCYRPDAKPSVRLLREGELDPPIARVNIFDISEQWRSIFTMFDFSVRSYDADEAKVYGVRNVLSGALHCFWVAITEEAFGRLCVELLQAEGVKLKSNERDDEKHSHDAFGEMWFTEAAGFRRSENWAFQFRNHKDNRVTPGEIRELESRLDESNETMDVVCLITSGDLTSIGNSVAVSNPRIRVWDRVVLNRLLHKHLEIVEKYFPTYPLAIKTLGQGISSPVVGSRVEEFTQKLRTCPPGHKNFSDFERIGTAIWCYLFAEELGKPKLQRSTADRVERRDVLFRNLRKSAFFQRISQKYDADFVIVDFKNHQKPVNTVTIRQVSQYTNKALGRFGIVVSRKGVANSARKAQLRLLKDDIALLSISDEQMLEMVSRKERGFDPADVLSDLLDELVVSF